MSWSGFIADRRGVAALEMALITPAIAGVALLSFEVWQAAGRAADMRTALKAGAQYYMNGGSDDTAARSMAISAWERKPADGRGQRGALVHLRGSRTGLHQPVRGLHAAHGAGDDAGDRLGALRPCSTRCWRKSGWSVFAERLLRDRNGASAAEFALVLPIFITMILGVLQFGWAQHTAGSMRFALEQAARAMVLNPAMTNAAVKAMVEARLGTEAAEITISVARETVAGGQVAKLTGTYVHAVGIPGLASMPVNFSRTITAPLPRS